MINRITEIMNDVSFGKTNGRMVSDKSYAYDTIFFIGNYIKNNLKISSDGRKYYAKSSEQLHEVKRYTQAIFKLNPHSDGSQNYFMETINLFIFSNIFSESEIDNNIVLVLNQEEIFEWIIDSFENAYIFLYLLVRKTFENDGLFVLYENYFANQTTENLEELYREICEKSISVGTEGTQWSMQITKYCVTILGFANGAKSITRSFKVKNELIGIKDISINLVGTKTKKEYQNKNNDYFNTFSIDYVKSKLGNKLLIDVLPGLVITPNNGIYKDLVEQIDENIKLTEENVQLVTVLNEVQFSQLIERRPKTRRVGGVKKRDYETLNRIKKEIGDSGEELVFKFEKNKLKDTPYVPIPVSKEDDTLGYDIKSYELDGTEIHIEVKTQTKGKFEAGDFYLSANEMEQLKKDPKYVIYFVYNMKKNKADFIQIRKTDLEGFSFEPVVYKIRFKATI